MEYSRNRTDLNSTGVGGSPSFLVDHLATFNASVADPTTTASAHGAAPVTLMTPDDAMRRLHRIAMRRGIWPTRVTLVVTPRQLIVFDAVTNATMEQFTMSLVYRPEAICSSDSREVYNNVAVITVLGDASQHTPPEVHLFQCVNSSAQQLIDTILAAKSSKSPGEPLPRESPVDVWPERVLEFERAAQQTVDAVAAYQRSHPSNQVNQRAPQAKDAASNDKIVKSVEVLNRCFDDIERFMTRLQGIAEAYKELEKRRKNRKKKGPQPGDGMLSIRCRNPSEKDFSDVLSLFKVSFNLLARLKSHIHDPNSPELIHFLFTPLSLIIEASKSSPHSDDLVQEVVAPLLTSQSISLLRNCLTSKEMELWMTMGDAWTKSREQWTSSIPPYHLRFSDGWEPDRIYWSEEEQYRTGVASETSKPKLLIESPYSVGHQQPLRPASESATVPYPAQRTSQPPLSPEWLPATSLTSPSSIPANSDYSTSKPSSDSGSGPKRSGADRVGAWSGSPPIRSEVLTPNGQNRAAASKKSPPPAPLPKPFRGGPARHTYDLQDEFLQNLRARHSLIYQAIESREGQNHSELSVVKGDILEVLDDSRNWWRVRNHTNQVGHVPYTLLQPYTAPYTSPRP